MPMLLFESDAHPTNSAFPSKRMTRLIEPSKILAVLLRATTRD